MTIKFGTDGWRAVMCEEFTFANVRRVTRAIVDYLREAGLAGRGIIIGYDTRFLAERFAAVAADVCAVAGVPVYLTEGDAPTPVVAHAILDRGTAGALMFTASHNPPEYQGLKFIPDYAGPAAPEITRRIEDFLAGGDLGTLGPGRSAPASPVPGQPAPVTAFDPKPAYLTHLRALVDLAAVRAAGLRVLYDPMFGTGRRYLPDLLEEAGCRLTVIHGERDPLFGGETPEPIERHLGELISRVRAGEADLGLATDGDADRFGIIDRDGSYLSANQIIPLLFWHLVRKGVPGGVVRTVATTHLLDRLAARFGRPVTETPVGFKYICQVMREKPICIGGEESGGLSIGGHLPEKDGVLACLLVAELRAVAGRPLRAILAELMEEVGPAFSRRIDLRYAETEKRAIMRRLQEGAPAEIGGVLVTSVNRTDGVKLILADGSWVLVRASGTEPLLRVYVEASSPEMLERRIEDARAVLTSYLR
ncbi:MAG: phosphoglucomutase/phosphomannomutase family protein [Bacillota bacterium]|nr:phosphoglucomutase/phosphomannomutase family protein [Bacillota bacterium]